MYKEEYYERNFPLFLGHISPFLFHSFLFVKKRKKRLVHFFFFLHLLLVIKYEIRFTNLHHGGRRQVVGLWERAAANVGSSVLIIRLVKGGTLFYMWSECLFGLLEQTGPAVVALVIAVRPVAVYAFCAVSYTV